MGKAQIFFKKPGMPIILSICVLLCTAGSILYTQMTLLDIEEALPITILQQERDISFLLQDFSELTHHIKLANMDPNTERLNTLNNKLKQVEKRIAMIRAAYHFNNLVRASAMHALANPAVTDIKTWLSSGLYGMSPTSPTVLNLIETRASDVMADMLTLYSDATENASTILQVQSDRIKKFRNSIFIMLLFLTIVAFFLVASINRLWRSEASLLRTKQDAEIANKAKSDFLANMSHELRTPLNSIIGFSEMLRTEIFGNLGSSANKEYVTFINGSGKHLLRLIDDILDLSKIEAGEETLSEENCNIVDIIDNCLEMVSGRLPKKSLSFPVFIQTDIPDLKADNLKLMQIILNLLSNAIKFTPEGGEISISVSLDNQNSIVFVIKDSGIGIPHRDLAKVMDPFGQSGNTETRYRDGTGLGLALVKSLIELHDGSVSLESEVGQGTAVTVRFPAYRTITS